VWAAWQFLHSGMSDACFASCGTYRWGLVLSPLGAFQSAVASVIFSNGPWQSRQASAGRAAAPPILGTGARPIIARQAHGITRLMRGFIRSHAFGEFKRGVDSGRIGCYSRPRPACPCRIPGDLCGSMAR